MYPCKPKFICPFCEEELDWCKCDDWKDEIECNVCHSKNVKSTYGTTSYGAHLDLRCNECGNTGRVSLQHKIVRRNERMDSTYCKGCDDLDYKENMSGKWRPWCLFWDCWVENVGSCDKFD